MRVNYGLLYLCSYLATCSFIFVFANIENSKWREYEFTIDGKKRDRYIEWRGYEFRLDAKKQNRYIEWRRYEFRIDGKKQNRYIEWRGYEFRIDGKKRHRYIEWRGYEIDEKKQDGGDTLKIRVESIFSFVIINARKFRGLRCFVHVYVYVYVCG